MLRCAGPVLPMIVSLLVTASMAAVTARHVWPNADVTWSWELVDQLMGRAPFGVSLVDGNRILPDLLGAAGVHAVADVLGVTLLARDYVIIYSIAVLAALLWALHRVDRSVGSAIPFSPIICALMIAANQFWIEAIRPGYHAGSAAVAMVLIARRMRDLDRPYAVGDAVVLALLVASSRFLLLVLVVPLLASELVTGRFRSAKAGRVVAAAAAGFGMWKLLPLVPGVAVSRAETERDVLGALTWPLEAMRGGRLHEISAAPGALGMPSHAIVMTGAFGTLGVLVLLAIGTLRRGGSLDEVRSAPLAYLAVLAVSVLAIGGASLRLVGYLVGLRTYIFVMPLAMACAAIGGSIGVATRSRVVGRWRVGTAIAAVITTATLGAASVDIRAAARVEPRGPHDTALELLADEGLLQQPGLTNYWVGYGVRGSHGWLPMYNVDSDLDPYYWVINPNEMFTDPRTGRIDPERRFSYVLSLGDCAADVRCDADGFVPPAETITARLGEPTRWVHRNGTDGKRYRLAVWSTGAPADPIFERWLRWRQLLAAGR